MKLYVVLIFCCLIIGCKRSGCIYGDCDNGYGTYRYENGAIEKGFWKNGELTYCEFHNCMGAFEGDFYQGFMKGGIFNGKGCYFFKRFNSRLYGNFIDGKPDGLCTVIFDKNSSWKGAFTGYWKDGKCKELDNFLRTSKDGEFCTFTSLEFFDSINFYLDYCNLNGFIENIVRILHTKDFSNEKVSYKQVSSIIDLYHETQIKLDYSIKGLNKFMEYDNEIQYKKAMIDYLTVFKSGLDNEFANYILIIQHNPDKYKPSLINKDLRPFIDRVKRQNKIYNDVRHQFYKKYEYRN